MKLSDIAQTSIKAILANKLRSFLTMLGIVIGVTSVIVLVALVSGLQSFITETISSLGPNVMFVLPGKIGSARGPGGVQIDKLTLQDATTLSERLNGIAEVSGAVDKVTKVKYLGQSIPDTSVSGVQANYDKIIQSIKITQGRFFNISEVNSKRRVAIIGPSVQKKLFGDSNPIGKRIIIGSTSFTVIGITAPRGSNFGIDQDNIAIIPVTTAQDIFGYSKVSYIVVSTPNSNMVSQVQSKVESILSKRLSTDDFTVQTQQQTLSTITQITGVLTIALGGIAAISLLVGGIGIMNIMLVSVTERTREIGLRKAIGARSSDIRNQFLFEALILSGLGGIVGIALGILIAVIANNFITTTIPLWSIGLSFGFSMLVGVVFGVAPALRAARLDPIQALRYE